MTIFYFIFGNLHQQTSEVLSEVCCHFNVTCVCGLLDVSHYSHDRLWLKMP
jgi:hypothetical protein